MFHQSRLTVRWASLVTLSFIIAAAGHAKPSEGSKRPSVVVATYAAKPDYPYIARAHHMEGKGIFLVHIRADGKVRAVEMVQSTGHPELDKSAVAAFQKWRFQVAEPTQVKIPIIFFMGGVRTEDPIPVFTR